MDGVNRVWKVVQQYNGQSIIPIIILIGILFLVVREKKNTNYLIVYLGVLLLTFNEVTYYLIRKLGEGMTYYRFLWMIPMVIISAYVIMKLFEMINGRKRKVFAAGICVLCFAMTSGISMQQFFQFPENIYQMPQNTVDVCDIIEKDRQEKSPVTVLADNSIMYGIREYNANIQKVMEEDDGYLWNMLESNNCDVSGFLGKVIISQADIDYIVIPNKNNASAAMLMSAGSSYIGSSQDYGVYRTNYDVIAQTVYDKYYTGAFQSDISTYYDEDVDIPEVTEDGREYVYYPDNHVALVDRETQEYTHYFQQDKEFQMVEEKEYILCAVDDSNGSVSQDTLEKMQKITASGKAIILFLKKPIYQEEIQADNREEMLGENSEHTDAITQAFIKLVKDEDSHIAAVFSMEIGTYNKHMLNDEIWQCICGTEDNNQGTVIRIR